MANIYYNNNGTITQLTANDFEAAAINHTHTSSDIIGTLPISKGGSNRSTNYNYNGVYYGTAANEDLRVAHSDNGVFGYYDGPNTAPSFQTWPVTNGGTGCTSTYQINNYFQNAFAADTDISRGIDFNNRLLHGFLTTSRTELVFTLPVYRPILSIGSIGGAYLRLCFKVWQNASRSKAVAYSLVSNIASSSSATDTVDGTKYMQYNRRFRFQIPFNFNVENDYDTCENTAPIYKAYDNGTYISSSTTYGTAHMYWNKFGTSSNLGYRIGSITIKMIFNTTIASNAVNNWPVLLAFNEPANCSNLLWAPQQT